MGDDWDTARIMLDVATTLRRSVMLPRAAEEADTFERNANAMQSRLIMSMSGRTGGGDDEDDDRGQHT